VCSNVEIAVGVVIVTFVIVVVVVSEVVEIDLHSASSSLVCVETKQHARKSTRKSSMCVVLWRGPHVPWGRIKA
jgi:hypothetical protein